MGSMTYMVDLAVFSPITPLFTTWFLCFALPGDARGPRRGFPLTLEGNPPLRGWQATPLRDRWVIPCYIKEYNSGGFCTPTRLS